ncbi:GNAT family N-acetyltransferase [Desulfomonile tiedjei]|uniref:Acetyl-CoA hydrolase n=1 Tax=Desulfomonile tiedjei (strain ATCC 49306 / DSM 6799 / DCB-1) TaxID=706587 RepID=I4C3U4_DESTA|nr:GNAT family N-acetyltransferase [Desulfomonile tiedjei]AFM24235.1 acetyl-CoA hydrolase [Desulfomonile tiedjei DSM 6799]
MVSDWKSSYRSKIISTEEAASKVQNGDRIYLGSMCSEPVSIIKALGDSYLEDVEIVQFINGSAASELTSKGLRRFRMKTFFVSGKKGDEQQVSEADYVPLFHSQIPFFLRNRRIPIDVAIVQVAPPDRFGRFSLGISVDITMAAVESARTVIAQVNPYMPRTNGDTFVPVDKIHYLVDGPEPLCEPPAEVLGEREAIISKFVAELIDDGSILQLGFAGISHGLLDFLTNHKNLGIHTEIFTDPLADLIERGVITNSTKRTYRGKCLTTSCMGTRRLYDYVHENALVEFYPSDVLLNPMSIATNDNMVAVNLALQVDLRGQIRQGIATWTAFEGSGGDNDFMIGTGMAKNGRSVVCLRSTSLKSGRSTIVPSFGPKSAVIMNRGEVNYIVTEYGIAYLGGKSIRERAMALIEIAHPNHREDLMRDAREMGYVYPDQFYFMSASPQLRKSVRMDHMFKGDLLAHIRVIKPTDESMIRDLFYTLSQGSVYFRYFSPRRSMPHANVQQYVSITEDQGLSLVVTIGPRENRRIIAESRYVFEPNGGYPDIAFMVDENYQGRGIATFLVQYMIEIAKARGVKGFCADVLFSNKPMLKVFERLPYVLHKTYSEGVVTVRFAFDELKEEQVPMQAKPMDV